MSTDADPLVGRLVLGRYRVLRSLARGGMGVIYLARQEGAAGFARPVVIKRVVPGLGDDESMIGMFVREAHILSNLQHPSIVDVIDFGQQDEAYELVLEYVQGHDLGKWRRYLATQDRVVPVDIALYIMTRVLEALHYAHTLRKPDGTPATVVHRDVTPSNILLHIDGHVKLADFGIARMSNLKSHYHTQTLSLRGKLAYMAPELFRSEPPSPQTDVYACGVVLHEILTGTNEFRNGEMPQVVHRILHHMPSPVTAKRPDAPRGLDAVIARALAKEPADRYPDAAAMAGALRKLRRAPEDDVVTQLATALRADFYGNMPEAVGVTPLEVLDAAWRTPTPNVRSGRYPSPPDVTIGPRKKAGAPPPPPPPTGPHPETDSIEVLVADEDAPRTAPWWRRALPWAAGGMAAVTIALLAALAWPESEPAAPNDPRYILLEQDGDEQVPTPPEPGAHAAMPKGDGPKGTRSTAGTAGGDPPAAGSADEDTPMPTRTASADPPPRRAHPPDRQGDSLSAAFARKQGRIQACFDSYGANAAAGPRLALRFRISAQGRVRSAELIPNRQTSTPLGQCLLQVAESVRFPAQSEPIAFRIPIEVAKQ